MAFTSDQAASLAGITYRQLDYWIRRGLIEPIGDAQPGSGVGRQFDIDEVFTLTIVADLVRLGANLDSATRVAGWMRMIGLATRGSIFIDVDGWILNEPPGACYTVDLDQLRSSLEDRAAALADV